MKTVPATFGQSFVRKPARAIAGITSVVAMAGLSLVVAPPAVAATAADCTPQNTVTATTGDETDIQALLDDVAVPVVCLSGTFMLSDTLTYGRSLTIYGLSDAVLDGNDAVSILNYRGSDAVTRLTVENLTVTHGLSDFSAGGINSEDLIVKNSVFEANRGRDGGAIQVSRGTLTVTDSTFAGNHASQGGAIYAYGVATIDASTFVDNESGFSGGAIYGSNDFEGEKVDVTNSTFVSNKSLRGGAIDIAAGTIVQSTFLDNEASRDTSPAIYRSYSTDPVSIQGNIFAGTPGATQIALRPNGPTVGDLGGNIFSSEAEPALTTPHPTSAFGISPASLFDGATLASNGGPTQTVALYKESPAVDFVPEALSSVTVDQRGVARTALSDAGAFEYRAKPAEVVPEPEMLAETGSSSTSVLAATGSGSTGVLAGAMTVLIGFVAVAVGMARRLRRRSQ
jgi:predicted outer membrane repeat protein